MSENDELRERIQQWTQDIHQGDARGVLGEMPANSVHLVAKDLGRRWIGIELSPEYVALAQQEAGVTVDDPDQLLDENERPLSAFAGGGSRD